MKKFFVAHPFLFAIFPVLSLFANNYKEVAVGDILLPMVIVLLCTFLLLFLSIKIFGTKKGAVIVSIFVILFSSYGHAFSLIDGAQIAGFVFGRRSYLLLVWVGVMFYLIYRTAKTNSKLLNLNKILNIISTSLVLVSAATIGYYWLQEIGVNTVQQNGDKGNVSENFYLTKPDVLPDIYYIILDGHASQSVLRDFYNRDNQEFIDNLTDKGFYVVPEGRSNYQFTDLSLSSVLNMKYHQGTADLESRGVGGLAEMVEDNAVKNILKSAGYKFVHYGGSSNNTFADVEISCNNLEEFWVVLAKTTMLNPFDSYIFSSKLREGIACALSALAEVPEIAGPKFVIAHFISPHAPFIFGEDGEEVSSDVEFAIHNWPKEPYADQLIYLDRQIEILVDEILSKSEVPPIIVIQGDHGPASLLGEVYHKESWDHATDQKITDDMLRERLGVLNAYYLPAVEEDKLYSSITPVNTFRLIFNEYFGTDYEILEDRSYFSNGDYASSEFYDFVDVTDRITNQ